MNTNTFKDENGVEQPNPLPEIPMGVSQWLEHGKRYGYWDHFIDIEKQKMTLEFDSLIAQTMHELANAPLNNRNAWEWLKILRKKLYVRLDN